MQQHRPTETCHQLDFSFVFNGQNCEEWMSTQHPPPLTLGLTQTTSAILARAHSRREQSFSSVDRLLSHSHHAIPFPVSHPEFWPFPFSLTSGRQRVNKVRSLPVVTRALGLKSHVPGRSSSPRGSISISSLARARHGQAVTLEAKDRMTLSRFRADYSVST